MKIPSFVKLEEELLEHILAPLHTMVDRLKSHIGKKTAAITDSERQIVEARAAIEQHTTDRTNAITALNNISALLGEKAS